MCNSYRYSEESFFFGGGDENVIMKPLFAICILLIGWYQTSFCVTSSNQREVSFFMSKIIEKTLHQNQCFWLQIKIAKILIRDQQDRK